MNVVASCIFTAVFLVIGCAFLDHEVKMHVHQESLDYACVRNLDLNESGTNNLGSCRISI
jgi:hypothetical protein